MITRNKIYKVAAAGLFAIMAPLSFTSCSDDFLAEKRPYGRPGPDQVYSDVASVKLRLNYVYQKSQPYAQFTTNIANNPYPDIWPIGYPDVLSLNTDEFPGYGRYTTPSTVWTNTDIDKYFFYGINESPWKKMRECTDVIVRTNESEFLTDLLKREVDGQARFFRATRYFRLFKRYGGLPIVTDIQSTLLSDTTQLRAPRTSTEETFNFIISDLTTAGDELPARWEEEVNDWGRITSGACYALAGIVANYYASPVFNRQDEQDRWQKAYELNQTALQKLAEGHFGLSYVGQAGENAKNWARIWTNMMGGETLSSEAVYVEICNNYADDKNNVNAWEQQIRPTNARGSCNGSSSTAMRPTAEMIDAFPMADGKRPEEVGQYTYDKKLFFLNRDPRFYRTFAFPGTQWRFSGSIGSDYADQCPYLSGQDYQLQNFGWFTSLDEVEDATRRAYYTDLLGTAGQTVYIRKKSQDLSLGDHALYLFNSEDAFKWNGQPLIAIRYAEVLLNFAEAACGVNKLDEAWNALIQIRQRVGYEGDCGLDPAIRSDRAKMFEAILYERQIELAYEGKRFDDCHRWMLFDGGVGQDAIGGSSWLPTGWGGNTCQYLGVTPLNEKVLHELEIYFDPSVYMGSRSPESDPFVKIDSISKPTALTLDEDFTMTVNEDTGERIYGNANVQKLAEFYLKYMLRKDVITTTQYSEVIIDGEVVSSGYTPLSWPSNLYLMGLAEGDQNNNPNVVQTIGWNSTGGGMGVFDPLSKTPIVSTSEAAAHGGIPDTNP